jgi:hypothetical protein
MKTKNLDLGGSASIPWTRARESIVKNRAGGCASSRRNRHVEVAVD